jgi:hypothetical protein
MPILPKSFLFKMTGAGEMEIADWEEERIQWGKDHGYLPAFRKDGSVYWEEEERKREQWNEDNGYWYSYRGGFDIHCGKCIHRKDGRCEIIPSLCNRVDLFSGCKLKEVVDESGAGN